MKAEIWTIYVCDGVLAALHDEFYPVVELFIPELNFSVSKKSYFNSRRDRYAPLSSSFSAPDPEKIGEIELTESEVQILTRLKNAESDYQSFMATVKERLPESAQSSG